MKKTYLPLAAAGLLIASNAYSALSVSIYRVSGYNTGLIAGQAGGEFTAVTSDASLLSYYSSSAQVSVSGQMGFETFCLEQNEHFTSNPYIGTFSSGAINGGVGFSGAGSSPTFDPISVGTAYLYSQFAAGTLAGYDYSAAGRLASARLLQDAIWYLEDESVTDAAGGSGNIFYQAAFAKFGAGVKNNNTQYAVEVLNLVDANGQLIQSQLVNVPEPSTVVAGALLLLPFGVSTLRILRKKQVS